jgi:hypothetical protein
MMAKSLVVTCDVCGTEGARSYGVSVDDHKWSVDLCDADAKEMIKLAGAGQRNEWQRSVATGTQRTLESRIRGIPSSDFHRANPVTPDDPIFARVPAED